MKKVSLRRLKINFLTFLLTFFSAFTVFADVDSASEKDVFMLIGDLETIKVYSLTRISMVDPSIADITNATEDEILLIGQKVGQTAMFVWDGKGKRTMIVHVADQDLELAKERLLVLFESVNIHEVNMAINKKEGKIVLTGDLPKEKKDSFDSILETFDEVVLNFVKEEEITDLVELDVQITELNKSLLESIGIDWFTDSSEGGLVFNYEETPPETDGSIADFFKIGEFNRTFQLQAAVTAILQEGKGKILSRPNVVVKSGEQATFLVGGEIPIRTTTVSDSGTTENITFKEYGVNLSITPEIKRILDKKLEKEIEKVEVQLNVEVSDVDASAPAGDDIAFVTRSADTVLYLDDKQTIIMAGLIKHNESEVIKKVPFLWKIPILGILFRSKSQPAANSDTELVISLRPTILKPGDRTTFDKNFSEEHKEMLYKFLPPPPVQTPVSTQLSSYYKDIPFSVPSEGMEEYVKSVQRKILSSISYPQEALQYGWEGVVKLNLLILKDGNLGFAVIKESSGHKIFDEEALETARRAAPYEKFPATTNLPEINIVVPVMFSLGNR